MNVGELLRERGRLLTVIEEAKTARHKLRQVNILIAMYGDDEKVSLQGLTAICLVPECDYPIKFRGVCGMHYQRFSRKSHDYKEVAKVILPSKAPHSKARRAS